jgi:hypothetical protein
VRFGCPLVTPRPAPLTPPALPGFFFFLCLGFGLGFGFVTVVRVLVEVDVG